MHSATITGDLSKNFWRPAPGGRQPVMGAKWGAIIGRYEATQGLLLRSIWIHYQLSSHSEPHRATARISFASR
jgi:hypothetical protein